MSFITFAIHVSRFDLRNIPRVSNHGNQLAFRRFGLGNLLFGHTDLLDRVAEDRTVALVPYNRHPVNWVGVDLCLTFFLLYIKMIFCLSKVFLIGSGETLLYRWLKTVVLTMLDTLVGQGCKGRSEFVFSI